ncbi:MAG TPA: DUF2510 domain-containing protein [Acidimicrobiales bacterium]|nr:DUF2510 domain-containing protein [Acidimicrobiales bacterium]
MTATAGNAAFGVGIAALIIVWLVIVVGSVVSMVVALIDIVRRPEWQWKLARQEKVLWLLLVILINFLAIPALIYWFNIRKKLLAVEHAAARGEYGPGHFTYAGWEPGPPPNPYVGLTPPGWYPDGSGQNGGRWWDGTQWTEHVQSAATPPDPSGA